MGNYLVDAPTLLRRLREAHRQRETDFGCHGLPRLLETHRLFAYDFARNDVPGVKDYPDPAFADQQL